MTSIQTVFILCAVINVVFNSPQNIKLREKRLIKNDICFEDLGCFNIDGEFYLPFIRPIQLLPQSRKINNVRYFLHTRYSLNASEELKLDDDAVLLSSHFNGTRPTKLIIHGFLENSVKSWITNMFHKLLLAGDYNIILVDWRNGSSSNYFQAASNARVVGLELSLMINYLEKKANANPTDFHCIGYCLGAHVAGYAGERLNGMLGRISGLDPAGPYFENTPPKVRLDPTDALFVDVIHTDGKSILNSALLNGGIGLFQPIGHIDFYPNGGQKQPHCSTNLIKNVLSPEKIDLACDHQRAQSLYTDTIMASEDCSFKAFSCDSYEKYKAAKCTSCKNNDCANMGFYADSWKHMNSNQVKMFLDTNGKKSYCLHSYFITVYTGSAANQMRTVHGNMYITLHGTNGSSNQIELLDKTGNIEASKSYATVLNQVKGIGQVNKITFGWKFFRSLWNMISFAGYGNLLIEKITVVHGDNEALAIFCGNITSISSDTKIEIHSSEHC